ncbi:methylcrotonoyl-CoA carboxylase beta chain, mitochondrial-like [Castanea sativa]|uniref:methylcrotonoyl-CoA carboxylase beta chain, mitochondrial-like n=1 Tax=Castanea sativa TaxID=21020 RepID=UPI003F649AF1
MVMAVSCAKAAGVLDQIEKGNKKSKGFSGTIRKKKKDSRRRLWRQMRKKEVLITLQQGSGIIDPADTRKIIGLCISASLKCPAEDTRYGVLRM